MAEKEARARLIEAALPLFATKGFKAVSIKEISQTAGVNGALINYYFGSKDGLYEAVLESQFSKFHTLLLKSDWLTLEPIERVRQFICNFIQLHRTNPYIRRLMTSELNHPSSFFESLAPKYIRKLSGFLIQTIEEGMAKGQFRDDLNPTCTTAIIVGMVNYYFLAEPVLIKFLPKNSFENDWDSFGLQAVKICFEGILQPGNKSKS
jgi:TetR/AcrR family transcriptional regulator